MNSSPSLSRPERLAEAAEELLRRRRVRRSLAEWARHRGFEPAAHHRLIIREIEAFLDGNDDVLLLFAPPGSAKSTYVSVLLPSWYLANRPHNSILAATHSLDFAERWGRHVRNDIAAESPTLGLSLSADSHAAARWSLVSGGEYYGVGAGSGISGFRADLGIVDDCFANREDAYSAKIRQARWDWYIDDFSARLKPRAKRVLMMTRWHLDDVAGRVIEQIRRREITGKIISIPAIAEGNDPLGRKAGEYLWDDPEGYNYGSFLRARERETSPMMWAALYQQRPVPEEGDYFKADWLRTYDTLPPRENLTIYGASDWAVTDDGDYTVHLVVGLDPDGRMYVLDVWRQQATTDVWIEAFCDLVLHWKPLEWAEEKGQIKAAIGPFLERRQQERSAHVSRRAFPSKRNKRIRAQSIRGRMALEGLYLPREAPWLEPLRSELLLFDAGKHDDQVDALGLIGQMLDDIVAGRIPPRSGSDKNKSKYRRLTPDEPNPILTL